METPIIELQDIRKSFGPVVNAMAEFGEERLKFLLHRVTTMVGPNRHRSFLF